MQSVAVHRASVPAVISKALEQQLQAMRPPGFEGVAGADDVAQAAAGEPCTHMCHNATCVCINGPCCKHLCEQSSSMWELN